jgi:hypothetical protein
VGFPSSSAVSVSWRLSKNSEEDGEGGGGSICREGDARANHPTPRSAHATIYLADLYMSPEDDRVRSKRVVHNKK